MGHRPQTDLAVATVQSHGKITRDIGTITSGE